MERLLRVKQAADLLCISKSGLYSLVSQKKIGHVRLGARVLFRESDLDSFISENVHEAQ